MSQATTIKSMYEAFGRGDVPTILSSLADDVQWDFDRAANDVPWMQPLRGRAAVPKFFEAYFAHVDLRRFEPKQFLEGGDTVVVLCDVDEYARGTGKHIAEALHVHVWKFDTAGKVASFKHAVDAYGASQALKRGD